MAKDWDYAHLTHTAAQNGGPKQFIDKVANSSYQQGIEAEKDTEGWKAVLVVGLTIGLWEGAKAIYRKHKIKKATKIQALAQEVKTAQAGYLKAIDEEIIESSSNSQD